MDRDGWHHTAEPHERKWSTEDARQLGPFTVGTRSHSSTRDTFVSFLEDLTGIPGLVPDPHFRGGGLHEIRQGGRWRACDSDVDPAELTGD